MTEQKAAPPASFADTNNGSALPGNPNGPSQNTVQASQPSPDMTTNPDPDDPKEDKLDDEPGEQNHEVSSVGTDDVRGLRDDVSDMTQAVSQQASEPIMAAGNHLADAARQATFGQHQGAAVSVGHAVLALQRAKDVEPDPKTRGMIDKHLGRAVDAGQKLMDKNQPVFNPTYSKTWKNIPVVTL